MKRLTFVLILFAGIVSRASAQLTITGDDVRSYLLDRRFERHEWVPSENHPFNTDAFKAIVYDATIDFRPALDSAYLAKSWEYAPAAVYPDVVDSLPSATHVSVREGEPRDVLLVTDTGVALIAGFHVIDPPWENPYNYVLHYLPDGCMTHRLPIEEGTAWVTRYHIESWVRHDFDEFQLVVEQPIRESCRVMGTKQVITPDGASPALFVRYTRTVNHGNDPEYTREWFRYIMQDGEEVYVAFESASDSDSATTMVGIIWNRSLPKDDSGVERETVDRGGPTLSYNRSPGIESTAVRLKEPLPVR